MLSHAYRFDPAPRPLPRYFDEIDTVSGTPEADVFEVQLDDQLDDQIFFNPIITNEVEPLKYFNPPELVEDDTRWAGQGRVIRKPGQGTAPPKEQPQFATQSWEWDAWWDEHIISMGVPIIVDESTASEVDILVYQEQERDYYLEQFQAPTARYYTYIDDFEPIEDYIEIGGDAYQYDVDDSEFRVVDDLEFRNADDSPPRLFPPHPLF